MGQSAAISKWFSGFFPKNYLEFLVFAFYLCAGLPLFFFEPAPAILFSAILLVIIAPMIITTVVDFQFPKSEDFKLKFHRRFELLKLAVPATALIILLLKLNA